MIRTLQIGDADRAAGGIGIDRRPVDEVQGSLNVTGFFWKSVEHDDLETEAARVRYQRQVPEKIAQGIGIGGIAQERTQSKDDLHRTERGAVVMEDRTDVPAAFGQ